MKFAIVKRPLRFPAMSPDPLSNGLVPSEQRIPATVFNDLMAVHPSVNHPGQGIWTATFAPTGQGIYEMPSEEEAECFAVELLKDAERGIVPIRNLGEAAAGPQYSIDLLALQKFCLGWTERRRIALAAYQAKKRIQQLMPSGIVATGWEGLWERLRRR